MTIDEPVFNPDEFGDDQHALLQAVVAQLHHVTERLSVLEQRESESTGANNPAPRGPSRARHHDPHAHRQTGWQPTRR